MSELSLLLLVYPLGALLVWLAPRPDQARHVALAAHLAGLSLALWVLERFDPSLAGFQMVARSSWIPGLHIDYAVGVDGLSVLFLPATALLFLGVLLVSWHGAQGGVQAEGPRLPRLYHSLLLLQAGATLGIFSAVDTLMFFLFWELSLVPFYFLVGFWGSGPQRGYAATKYTLVMFAGGVPLLFGFLLLAFNHAEVTGAGLSFDLATLLNTPLPDALEQVVFLLLLLGFAVKTPVFPLHTWLPLVAMEGPAPVVALLTGLKLGAYGLIRFAVPLAPEAAHELQWLLVGLGVVGMLFGAVAALAQTNLRAMLAYSSLSHVGLVVLGVAAFNLQGLQGAVLQLVNFSLISGGLFLIAALVQQRLGSTDLLALGGAARTMPILASLFLFLGLASLGLPGTSGFPAELLILVGLFQAHAGSALAALFAMVLGAGYFLNLYRRAFQGPVRHPAVARAGDLGRRERLLLLVFAGLVLVFGAYPAPLLELVQPAAQAWLGRIG